MKRLFLLLAAWTTAVTSSAELLQLDLDGLVHVRGRYWRNTYGEPAPRFLPPYGRALGPFGSVSRQDWDPRGPDTKRIELRSLVRANALFSRAVSAVIALESYDIWGEDFRSDWIAGQDSRAVSDNDVEAIESYVAIENALDRPLRIRIGRQPLRLGDGWLVHERASTVRAFIYDGIRLVWEPELWSVDLFWTKVHESRTMEEDGDVDFSGIHTRWSRSDAFEASLYWYWLRDARATSATSRGLVGEYIESLFGLDSYPTTNLHTMGGRAAGEYNAWDYSVEGAFQFGDAGRVGVDYRRFVYGDEEATFDGWAGDFELGYTTQHSWTPRFYLGGAYFSGEDHRGVSFWEWLAAPFLPPRASIGFNRLFSGRNYGWHFDTAKEYSNFWQVRSGVEFTPNENIEVLLQVAHYEVVEPFDRPRPGIGAIASFLTRDADTNLGTSIYGMLTYHLTEDLTFKAGWERLFTGAGLREGSYVDNYGHRLAGGTGGADADYFFFETVVRF